IFPLDPPRGREALERLGVDFGELSRAVSLPFEGLRAVSLSNRSNHLSSWKGTSRAGAALPVVPKAFGIRRSAFASLSTPQQA
ncbi:MAG: hypothetical protein ACE1Z6_11310, partial [Candidatus Methylomirabilales bacterium]